MSSQRRVVGDPLADLRRQERIDVQAGKRQLQIRRHVATEFNPSIHRQACRGKIRSRRELQMIAMGHRVGRNAAETVPVEHQATYLHMGIDERLFNGARPFCRELADASYLHARHLQFGDIRQIDVLAGQVEAYLLVAEVVGSRTRKFAAHGLHLDVIELRLVICKREVRRERLHRTAVGLPCRQ